MLRGVAFMHKQEEIWHNKFEDGAKIRYLPG